MLRSLWLLFIYVSFIGLSFSAPFIATLGYVWVDTFQPQTVAYVMLNQLPVAMIMGVVALGGYVLLDRRSPPPVTWQTTLQASLLIWICCTTFWAQVPDAAWAKWNWAFKTAAFATFIPYAIRSRVQIEAFAQIYVLALAANFVPFGLKVLISGGGYGRDLGLQSGNSGLGEGGLLSTACLMAVPSAVFLARHGQLLPRSKLLGPVYWGIGGLAVVTAIGTYERSALVGLVALGGRMWLRSKHKLWFGGLIALTAGMLIHWQSDAWNARILTIGDYRGDSSAVVRLLVWKWTIDFAALHPFGGGFMSYLTNHVELPGTATTQGQIEFARAFHSVYFELLGEQGYPGLVLFVLLAASTLIMLRRLATKTRKIPELQWMAAMADALQDSVLVFLSCGAFVGIAFQPMFWYFIAMGVCLKAYLWRVEHQVSSAQSGWRAAEAGNSDWRRRRVPETASLR